MDIEAIEAFKSNDLNKIKNLHRTYIRKILFSSYSNIPNIILPTISREAFEIILDKIDESDFLVLAYIISKEKSDRVDLIERLYQDLGERISTLDMICVAIESKNENIVSFLVDRKDLQTTEVLFLIDVALEKANPRIARVVVYKSNINLNFINTDKVLDLLDGYVNLRELLRELLESEFNKGKKIQVKKLREL